MHGHWQSDDRIVPANLPNNSTAVGAEAEEGRRSAKGAWLDASGLTVGPLFRSVWKGGRRLRPTALGDRAIAEVVKRAAQAAGYDPARFSGHSLRAGLVTTAAAAGVDERTIMEQTGHKTTTMVRRYMRRGSLFRNNAAAKVGL
jgi:integrase